MKTIPRISESEWLVMKTIWESTAITANGIVDALSGTTTWSPKTIKTLLNRLVKKGAVGYDNQGREYLYFPMIEQSVFVKEESRFFLKRVFGGALKPMLAALVESESLSPEDIEELKSILEKK
jgi:BlaI family transcriptional regulator, penicillinase repressor